MALIEWSDNISVGIESIDKQHKVLIGMINEFYDLIKIKSNNALIEDLIGKMKRYTLVHFKFEESLFESHNFPYTEEHKIEHQDFVNKVIDLEQRLQDGKLIVSFEVTSFLKKWLLEHIQGTDKKYTNLLVSKGVN